MNRYEFKALRYIYEHCRTDNYEVISEAIEQDEKNTKEIIGKLREKKLIDEAFAITKKGIEVLEPYRVKSAIILAAGMSTRFAPVSYELPKGLISVKGQVMTERLIEQLQEAGVREIVLVIGYMMEKFLYLRERYNVKLVVNNEFAKKNTHSSIYAARDYLSNTYICCADNYYPQNMFHQFEYRAFYCSVYLEGVSYVERAFTFDENDLIIDTNKPSDNQWIMYGHAYYDQRFTDAFKPILENYYGRPGVEQMYWETIYAENVKKLPMYIKKCKPSDILEFDSMEELKAFDNDYIRNNRVKVFENICKILCCELEDIKDIEQITRGLNNRSFKFMCKGEEYIYRHPGINASNVIDRKKEAVSLKIAKKLNIDETLTWVDEEEGWKISKYVNITEEFDFSNHRHIKMLAKSLKKLHGSKICVGFSFDYHVEAEKLIDRIKHIDSMAYRELLSTRKKVEPLFKFIEESPWEISLCHNDLYEPNLLVSGEKLNIIDWEFAGDSDIGFDICKLFSVEKIAYEEIDKYVEYYFRRQTTKEEKMHLIACAAIIYYYWFVWAVYVSKTGEEASEYMMGWYDKMNYFCDEFLRHMEEE